MQKYTKKAGIKKALKYFGSISKWANEIGHHRASVYYWIKEKGDISLEAALKTQLISKNELLVGELRKDMPKFETALLSKSKLNFKKKTKN